MGDSKKSSISKRSNCYLLNLKQPAQTAKRLKLSFQRTSATVSIMKAGRSVEASVGFLDVSETGAGVYTPELLNKGTVVELCITEPMILKVRGIVAWSAPVTSGVHQGKFKCRSGIQFVFDGEAQQVAVKEFVKKASADPVESLKAASIAPPVAPVAVIADVAVALDAPITPPAVDASSVAETAPAENLPTAVPESGEGTPEGGQQAA